MAVFTAITRAEAASFLTQFAIGELTDLQGIATGIENTNFFLTTTDGRYVLTIFERLTFKQLPFYLELMRHLSRRGLPVPAPQENRSGALLSEIKGKPAAIVTRLEGKAVTEPSASHCALVGEVLAKMHVAGSTSRCSSHICAASAGGKSRCRSSRLIFPITCSIGSPMN